jgi:hypothetical protein
MGAFAFCALLARIGVAAVDALGAGRLAQGVACFAGAIIGAALIGSAALVLVNRYDEDGDI